MSNQVYTSQNQKYFPSVGMNKYMCSNIINISSNQTVSVVFDTPVVISDSKNFTVNVSTGDILFNNDGLYSINGFIQLTDAVNPTSNDLDYGKFLEYASVQGSSIPDSSLDLNRTRIPARGGTSGNSDFCQSFGTVLYCQAGSVVRARVTNFAPTTLSIEVGATKTLLYVLRIA